MTKRPLNANHMQITLNGRMRPAYNKPSYSENFVSLPSSSAQHHLHLNTQSILFGVYSRQWAEFRRQSTHHWRISHSNVIDDDYYINTIECRLDFLIIFVSLFGAPSIFSVANKPNISVGSSPLSNSNMSCFITVFFFVLDAH